jgi:hypothetical protein
MYPLESSRSEYVEKTQPKVPPLLNYLKFGKISSVAIIISSVSCPSFSGYTQKGRSAADT